MARTFRRQRQSHPIAEMNVTNLIDLGFTLLIIFMIATPLITQDQTHPIALPLESKSAQEKPNSGDKFFSVSFDARGFYLGDQRTPVGLTELRTQLQNMAVETARDHLVIRIRGDRSVEYQKFIQILDELKKANLRRIDVDTQTDG